MLDHDSDEDDLLEQAYIFRTTGKYPEDLTTDKKRSIRRNAENWFCAMVNCTNGKNGMGPIR